MLPDNPDGRNTFMAIRDYRARWRKWTLESQGADRVKEEALIMLRSSADLEAFREQIDFMRSEGFLTEPMNEAASNVIAWAEALQTLLPVQR